MNYLNQRIFFIFFFLFAQFVLSSQDSQEHKANAWADSVYLSLSLDERVGQLIFIRANQSGEPYIDHVGEYIEKYNLGGIVFFAGDPVKQVLMTNEWMNLPNTPLMVAIDAEWGLGHRLINTVKYPLQMTLGATGNNDLIYKMGQQIGEQCRRMGIHINLAPVVDVNNNPANPVIGMRSFGELPGKVAEKSYQYMKGMQDAGIVACAKHFPGHGDTQTDSHVTLPVLNKSKKELRNTELFPFNYLIERGIQSIMIAHLSVPAFDKRKNRPASLSKNMIWKQLIRKMGFSGLVISDGLDMMGVTNYFDPKDIALEAFIAGNDILLIPENIPASIKNIKEAVNNGKVDQELLENSCKKILKHKYLTGAVHRKKIDTTNLLADLNRMEYSRTAEKLLDQAITIVKNENFILPVAYPDTLNPAILIIGENKENSFESTLADFFNAPVYRLNREADVAEKQNVLNKIEENDLVIIGVVNTNILASRQFGISNGSIQFIERIARDKNVILVLFASPYSLDLFSNTSIFKGIVVAYQDKPYLHKRSAEVILGMQEASGHLPVSADVFAVNTGIETLKSRLTSIKPEKLAISTYYLDKIDSIANNSIEIKAFPGCQILAAKDGYIFYNKSFGYHTYDSLRNVKNDDLYDLASLTKILATTPAIMKMVDDGKLNIDGKLSDYLHYLKGTNKEDIGFREVLTHQAGLTPWIPYYEGTLFETNWDTSIYRPVISEDFPVRVANNMYIKEDYHYGIYNQIIHSELGEKEYAYSDLGFYFFKEMIEDMTNSPFDQYILDEFYNPLGLRQLSFRPLKSFSRDRIIPTEFDQVFRHQVIRGDVHDQGAAMLGGVSGHAGLFGSAYDVAVVMQMLLNGGNYGGRDYISREVFDEFNRVQFPGNDNRRGLGFDKPMLVFEEHKGNCKDASPSSFGHSGFTGTYAWADPENGLIYVFLSNRVYPDMDNAKIMELDIRTNIHQLFYESIKSENLIAVH